MAACSPDSQLRSRLQEHTLQQNVAEQAEHLPRRCLPLTLWAEGRYGDFLDRATWMLAGPQGMKLASLRSRILWRLLCTYGICVLREPLQREQRVVRLNDHVAHLVLVGENRIGPQPGARPPDGVTQDKPLQRQRVTHYSFCYTLCHVCVRGVEDGVDHSRLQIHEDCPRDVVLIVSLGSFMKKQELAIANSSTIPSGLMPCSAHSCFQNSNPTATQRAAGQCIRHTVNTINQNLHGYTNDTAQLRWRTLGQWKVHPWMMALPSRV
ncbi:hypothetical protein F7725_003059 [Dissostichus mawsoni]|uniref:Uncharacterized protein n=1 Tax=Dissostichus mawsoni TaxID=36200 RepID=A0A7J5YAH1_DISMA|nr:hypothetical protein F7725_003059 [Dissostichus mawsoni]